MLTLHLLQPALVHVNTLLLNVLDIPGWAELLGEHDHRARSTRCSGPPSTPTDDSASTWTPNST